jgi:hypothetical protein
MKTFKQFTAENFSENPPDGYEKHLKDHHEIADHIERTSADEVDRDSMLDFFHGEEAHLKKTPIKDISPGDPNYNIPSKKKQSQYKKMSSHTRPPIVVKDGEIVDGNHRYRDALKKGETHIWAYHTSEKD